MYRIIFSIIFIVFVVDLAPAQNHVPAIKNDYNLVREGSNQDAIGNHTAYNISVYVKDNPELLIQKITEIFGDPSDKLVDELIWSEISHDELDKSSFKFTIKSLEMRVPKVDNWTILFFYARNENGQDLLTKRSKSQKRFITFFQNLVDEIYEE